MDQAQIVARAIGASNFRSPINDAARQRALDAAAVLQIRRSRIAERLASGAAVEAEMVGVGPLAVNEWMSYESRTWRETRSTRVRQPLEVLRGSMPLNRLRTAEGSVMVTLVDYNGLTPEARLLVANESGSTYLQGVAPVQMSIIDSRFVLLSGPEVDGQMTLMKVSAASCLEAAERYWSAAMDSTVPFDTARPLARLSPRQRQIAALLGAGTVDDVIAAILGLSVRTVRSDIAGILQSLDARSRFEAGARLTKWEELAGDVPDPE